MSQLRTFNAILWRDVFVTGRELPSFLAQVIIQPFFILFIFAKVLGDIGYVQDDFAQVLLPGIIAMNGFLGALRGLVAAILMVPVGFIMLDVSWPLAGLPGAFLVIVLGCLAGGSVGLVIGTSVPARRVNVMFAVILTPILFTGSAQFPWRSLSDDLLWFKVICALNPLTYVSEGMRAELVPDVPHMPFPVTLAVLVVAIVGFGALGLRGFMKRALD